MANFFYTEGGFLWDENNMPYKGYYFYTNRIPYAGINGKDTRKRLFLEYEFKRRVYSSLGSEPMVEYININPYTPTKEEIEEEGLYFKRYFYQKRIKPITSITEISKDDYFSAKNLQDNKNRLIFAEIYWKVRGDKVKVAQLNRNEVLSAETTFPGLKRFIVNYNEFYIDDGY